MQVLLRRFCALFFCLVVLPTVQAQITRPNDALAPPVPGVGHDYIKMLNETVDPENGGVSLRIQVPVPPGRKLTLPFSFNYDSTETRFFLGDWSVGFGLRTWSNLEPFASGAWSYGLPRLTNFTQTSKVPGFGPSGGSPDGSILCGVTLNYTFVDINGSSHQLYLAHVYDNTEPTAGVPNYQCTQAHFPERDAGGGDSVFQASFTNLQPDSDHDFSNPTQPNDGQPVVAGPDGTLYTFPPLLCGDNSANPVACSRLPASIEDKNGNILTIANTGESSNNPTFSVIDTAGRTALTASSFGQTGSTVAVSGLAQPYTLIWTTQNYPGYSVNTQNQSAQGTLFCAPSGSKGTGAWTQSAITAIQLPNGQSYQFTYDPLYGTLAKIVYPSGGYIRYTYGLNPLSTSVAFNGSGDTGQDSIIVDACYDYIDTVAVIHRYVSFDGVHEVLQQDYTYSTTWAGSGTGWNSKQTTVTTHDFVRATTYSTAYTYSGIQIQAPPGGSGVNAQAGLEQSIAYSDITGTLLKTATKGWTDQFSLGCEVDTWGSSGPSSAVFYTYGLGDVVTDVKEYDYGLVGPSSCFNGATAPNGVMPTRETATTYQTFNNTTYPSSPTLLDSPCRVVVQNSNGIAAETDSFYDGGTSLCGSAGTPSVTAVVPSLPQVTRDPLFGSSGTISRGNPTRVQRVNSSGSSPITTMAYDETGQVTSITDPCGNTACSDLIGSSHTTTYSYADNPIGALSGNSNAYLTKVTSPTTNGIAQVRSYAYDYQNGQLSMSADENNQPTNYTYSDPLNRLTEIQGPPDPNNGSQRPTTTYLYNDASPSPTMTTSQLLSSTEGWKTSLNVMDGVEHVIQTQLTSDPAGTEYVDTTYDGMERVASISNPHRNPPSPNDPPNAVTSYTYDSLGRKLLQCQPDNGNNSPCLAGASYRQWSYNGTSTTFKDENGNSSQNLRDSFSRLSSVSEPGGLVTVYGYDALDNLMSVNQEGLPKVSSDPRAARSFTYDSLSRLICASNPENSSSQCPTSSAATLPTGAITYGYDLNGNLQSKTDGRGITTNYIYDAMNRLIGRSYSGQNTLATAIATKTPSSCFQYDTAANGVGRLASEWTQSGTCATSPPANPKSLRIILAYDPMGRILQDQQCTGQRCNSPQVLRPMSYGYDLAGNRTGSEDGLSTRSFVTQYDQAGRLLNFSGGAPGSAASLFSVQSYGPIGVVNATMGNHLTITKAYDSRERLTNMIVQGVNQ